MSNIIAIIHLGSQGYLPGWCGTSPPRGLMYANWAVYSKADSLYRLSMEQSLSGPTLPNDLKFFGTTPSA